MLKDGEDWSPRTYKVSMKDTRRLSYMRSGVAASAGPWYGDQGCVGSAAGQVPGPKHRPPRVHACLQRSG